MTFSRILPIGICLLALTMAGLSANALAPDDCDAGPKPYLALGHTLPLTAVAWSPNGRLVATGSNDATVVIWDVKSKQPVATLPHLLPIHSIAWSPLGTQLAVWAPDLGDWPSVSLWDVKSWSLKSRFASPDFMQWPLLAWSPDNRTLVVHKRQARTGVELLDAHTLKTVRQIAAKEDVGVAAFSPDGRWLALIGFTNEPFPKFAPMPISLWPMAEEGPSVQLKGQIKNLTGLSWSPNSRWLASTSLSKETTIWDVQGRRIKRAFKGKPYWRRDSRLLAIQAKDGLRFWDPQRDEFRSPLPEATGAPTWAPRGSRLAVTHPLRGTTIWDVANARRIADIPALRRRPRWSPDGRWLADISGREARLWDAKTGQQAGALASRCQAVRQIEWNSAGNRLAVRLYEAETAPIWDTRSGRVHRLLRGHHGPISSLSWRPDGRQIASASARDRAVIFWDAATGQELHRLERDEGGRKAIWSPDGRMIAVIDRNAIWTTSPWRRLAAFPDRPRRGYVASFAWRPDSRLVATSFSSDPSEPVIIWNPKEPDSALALPAETRGGVRLLWSPDGKQLAIVGRSCMLYDPERGQIVTRIGGLEQVWGWSPDSRLLAVQESEEGRLGFWNRETGEILLTEAALTDDVLATAWSPDSHFFAVVGGDYAVSAAIWDANTGKQRARLLGHTHRATAVAWRSDGKVIATGGFDGAIIFWDPNTGEELLRSYAIDDGRDWISVTPDGYLTASSGALDVLRWRDKGKLWPARKFLERFHRPEMIRKALAK